MLQLDPRLADGQWNNDKVLEMPETGIAQAAALRGFPVMWSIGRHGRRL
jgi:hypothetical protein